MQATIYKWSSWIDETDPRRLYEKYKGALIRSGFKVLHEVEHNFTPYGYTALFLLAESHFAIHTFPEENATYIELSSCVKEQFDRFLEITGSAGPITIYPAI